MMLRNVPVLLASVVFLFPATSHGDSLEASNYDECIIDAMRGVSSDVAARAIIESCRNLFPEPPREVAPPAPTAEAVPAPAAVPATPVAPASIDTAEARSLTTEELGRLSAAAKIFGSAYRVTVNNGNPNLTLTEVTIAVWDDDDPTVNRKEYKEAARIAPLTSGVVKYTVHYRGSETGWSWRVVAARGVE